MHTALKLGLGGEYRTLISGGTRAILEYREVWNTG